MLLCVPCFRFQEFFHCLQRPILERFYGVYGFAQEACYFVGLPPFDEPQGDYLALLGGEAAHGSQEGIAIGELLDCGIVRAYFFGFSRSIGGAEGDYARFFLDAILIGDEVAGNGEEPCLEWRACVVVAADFFEHTSDNFGYDIFGAFSIAHLVDGVAIELGCVGFNSILNRAAVPHFQCINELPVIRMHVLGERRGRMGRCSPVRVGRRRSMQFGLVQALPVGGGFQRLVPRPLSRLIFAV